MNREASPGQGIVASGTLRLPGICLALILILKVIYAWRLRIDSDETQHLHVVWGWTQGLLPYRDLFDNHSPLFQLLCAPFLPLFGERADIVSPMRLLMVPMLALLLGLTYRIGSILFSRWAGAWAAVVTAALPIFFVKSSEFRTDDLWAALWLLAVWLFLRARAQARDLFLLGLAVGACFSTSMKTSALVVSLALALPVAVLFSGVRSRRLRPGEIARLSAAGLLGIILLPALILVFFAVNDAAGPLYYCVIKHNLVPNFFVWSRVANHMWWCVPLALFTAIAGWLSISTATTPRARLGAAIVGSSVVIFFFLLAVVWPLVQAQDFLPVFPLMGVLVLGALQGIPRPAFKSYVPLVLAAGEVGLLLVYFPPRADAMTNKESMIAAVLKLTTNKDRVMDAKGETVFRRRPFYYCLEGITLRRITSGLIRDEIPERLIETRTPVATLLRMPARAHEFIERNYVPVAYRTRVLGQISSLGVEEYPGALEFYIRIPEQYVVMSEHGDLKATMDGKPADQPQFLAPGRHEVHVQAGTGHVALVWARAAASGFSPFAIIRNEEMGPED